MGNDFFNADDFVGLAVKSLVVVVIAAFALVAIVGILAYLGVSLA